MSRHTSQMDFVSNSHYFDFKFKCIFLVCNMCLCSLGNYSNTVCFCVFVSICERKRWRERRLLCWHCGMRVCTTMLECWDFSKHSAIGFIAARLNPWDTFMNKARTSQKGPLAGDAHFRPSTKKKRNQRKKKNVQKIPKEPMFSVELLWKYIYI